MGTTENTLTVNEMIAANLCNQILEFQKNIASREPGNRFPTPPEATYQAKMINCLDKLKKLAAPFRAATVFKNFFSFLANDDKELSATVKSRYQAFLGQNTASGSSQLAETTPATETTNQPENKPAPVPATLEINPIFNEAMIIRRDAPAKPVYSLQPPFSPGNFERYKALVFNHDIDPEETLTIDGRRHNSCWVQYNLFQFLLPHADRRFTHNEHTWHEIFNYYYIQDTIKTYCHQKGLRK